MKVIFCVPTRKKPHPAWLEAMRYSLPTLKKLGIEHQLVFRARNPYISYVMADMIFTSMQTDVDNFICLDDDLSWAPKSLAKLCLTPGDVVAGTYRYKDDDKEEYMGAWEETPDHRPVLRADGCIQATMVPTGFFKITRNAVRKFMKGYPHLLFGKPEKPGVDLFNHGVILPNDGRWWGQDYAFSKRWCDLGEKIWLIPNLNVHHHDWDSDKVFEGNLHKWLLRQPGGSEEGKNVVDFPTMDSAA